MSNLRKIRNERGYTLQKLGDLCGVAKPSLWSIENKHSNPTLRTAYRISTVLGVTVYDIWPNETTVEEIKNTTIDIKVVGGNKDLI